MAEHIYWQDIIQIAPIDHNDFGNTTPEEVDNASRRLKQFLDYVENTEMGQEKFRSIQEKYEGRTGIVGGEKIYISLNDNFRTVTFPTGNIAIDIRYSKHHAFIDQESGNPIPFSFERMVMHEITHTADERVKINADNNSPHFETVVEEYATLETDAFARQYMPELGIRGAYGNVAGQTPEDFYGIKAIHGTEVLKNDKSLQTKIKALVETVEDRIKRAQEHLDQETPSESNEKKPILSVFNPARELTNQEPLGEAEEVEKFEQPEIDRKIDYTLSF